MRARIVADADGLRLHWPLRAPRRVSWSSIEGVGTDAWGDWVSSNGHKIYWARALFPARRAALRALIEHERMKEGED